jgi:regulator of protease activity HflC (stomatin/prohibitin superfamily)
MILLKYVFLALSAVLFGAAAGVVGYDVWLAFNLRRLLRRAPKPEVGVEGPSVVLERGPRSGAISSPGRQIRWRVAGKLAGLALLPLLVGVSIAVVPDGDAGVRISQISGVRPGTLYPGVHLLVPMVESIATYDLHDRTYVTSATPSVSIAAREKHGEQLTVQAREGLTFGLGVAVRYRLDPQRLAFIHANVPQPIDEEVVAPVVATIFREVAAGYVVRDVFTVRRVEFQERAAKAITERLAKDGILVKEVMVRDFQLPAEYAKGLESMLLKEQESERLGFETEIKQKQVRIAELEAEAQKTRDIKQAEAAAQVHVLQAKSESDAMQYTLPLKQKQIEQSRLEAEARKEATIQNAQAAAESKVIDSRAEVQRRNLLAEADAHTIRVTAAADSERMNLEAAALRANPLLIQKMIAERLSDKLQIIMVPMDGKNFFAGDVLRSAFAGLGTTEETEPRRTGPAPAPPPRRPDQRQ